MVLRALGAGSDGLRRNDAANPSYVICVIFVVCLVLYLLRVIIPNYRRCRVASGCYFFTVNLLERSPNDVLTRHVDVLRGAVAKVKQARPFHIDAWVVLPDHLHCV